MSHKEIDRLETIQAVTRKHLTQKEAACRLDLSVRQIKRLVRRYRNDGPVGLISRHRGRPASNAIKQTIREAVMALVREHYHDFGPTLACEKLVEHHGHALSPETLRQWMIAEGLWQSKGRKQARIHQRRARRPCMGDLVQIDGSPHDWFEGRGPRCTLIVFIDDATSNLMALRFAPTETTRVYMETLQAYLAEHGRPVALYSDKHSIFRVNHPDREAELTQFSRALKTLDIQPVHANSPQAKGRVERANQTLQDRLVKELRLKGISDIESANAFLSEFMADYNTRFAVAAQNPVDAHREVLHNAQELSLILSLHHTRKLSKNLTFQFRNQEYQLEGQGKGYRLRHSAITLCEGFDGSVTLLHEGKSMPYRVLMEGEPPIPLDDEKSLAQTVEQAKAKQLHNPGHKPAPDHPWRRMSV